ncbi:ATP-dependent DNA ligase [Parafrankia irregularis]|uniref:DNA ligase (ATP) n=1 Tax=Parafrankia irregularis TaxID=795642 RepID=A0A0S4QJR2_9ACTN|nr:MULTISPECIES: ATP-dependent DNA ligase [Parafrankia]MBE3202034.1 ATP-dependent DNA ligase [Parafrankia sp. CH37]CUU55809.1 ATP-dependent DNA ligase [Parafrankia irregularis]
MDLPVMPPVKPMLARAASAIPPGMLYEPKWDGFRALVFRDGAELEITSRNTRPMTRYFPELVEILLAVLPERCVLDGEIVVIAPGGLDFEELSQRVHPAASRVDRLARETPVSFVAFDLLALGDTALVGEPLARRRAALEDLLAGRTGPGVASSPPPGSGPADTQLPPGRPPAGVYLTPATDDPDLAADWFRRFEGAGLDGLVAKPPAGHYEPDKRAMIKVKHERTADCVVAGYRPYKNDPAAVGSLLLGLYDGSSLLSVGVTSAFPMARRRELVGELAPLVTAIDDHPWARPGGSDGTEGADGAATRTPWDAGESRWARGRDLSFVPLRPERVVEVRYDHMEGPRFRHTTQFVRFRPDRDPLECTYEQLERPIGFEIADVLSGSGG